MKRLSRMLLVICLIVMTGLMTSLVKADVITIRINARHYTPTASMERSAANPYPHNQLAKIIAAYEKTHPNVKIECLKPLGEAEYRTWMITQLSGGTAPEILHIDIGFINQDINKNWWLPIDKYLDMPNPYVAGNKKWRDTFVIAPGRLAADGLNYVVAVDAVTSFEYYNKDIFAKLKLKEPQTWVQYISLLKKLKEAGYQATGDWGYYNVRFACIEDTLLDPLISQLDVITKDGKCSTEELVRGIKKGIYSAKNPRYREVWRLVGQTVPYWQDGWQSAGDGFGAAYAPANRDFRLGTLAIFGSGCWSYGMITQDPNVKFGVGAFRLPKITTSTSGFATGKETMLEGGLGAIQWGMTNTVKTKGIEKEVIDWLMYLSAPQNANPMIREIGQFMTNMKGAADQLEQMGPGEQYVQDVRECRFYFVRRIDAQYDTEFERIQVLYYLKKITLADAMIQMQTAMNSAADRLITQFKYDTSKW